MDFKVGDRIRHTGESALWEWEITKVINGMFVIQIIKSGDSFTFPVGKVSYENRESIQHYRLISKKNHPLTKIFV